ncbi:5-hydroxyisourate hydrolase isoform X1 [Oncorhynchus mykiss]|uniref:5-hydroxyisourate hydrolase isoform X1 n=1 Tax=Oncorhynchus mykiss TaxID=8022 RepID=UPI001878A53C|nr:5-hydroxyisourate hydrolase isoform X1 [Oncorhynchus mykiss]
MTSKSARMSTSRLQHIKDHLLDEYTCAEMAAPYSPLTTHVLNTGMGVPGAHMALSLHRMDPSTSLWNLLTTGTTNDDGRCPGLITRETFTPAVYKMRFETGQYWGSLGETSFYPYVEIVFTITDHSQKFHVPLLCSRFSYTTYRGS